MNRRGTEPYARWCERPGRATSPAYSIPGKAVTVVGVRPKTATPQNGSKTKSDEDVVFLDNFFGLFSGR